MKFVLAPLADYTDAPFRLMCREGGADLVVTEMVSAAALAHGHGPTRQLMETMEGEGPVACQIFGSSESDVAVAAREATGRGFVALDLNAGCPMPNVTRSGAGAKLVEDPAKIGRLLAAMKENTDIPVTLKTRLGPHPKNTTVFEIVSAAESAGASAIAIHARYTSQLHGGPVHLDTLAEVVRATRLPVTGNGSVKTPADAVEMAATGVSGIMLGRAALGNPGVFAVLKAATGDRTMMIPPVDGLSLCRRHLEFVLRFHEQLVRKFSEAHVPSLDAYAALKMRRHFFHYFKGVPGAATIRARFNAVKTLAEIKGILFPGSSACAV